MTLTLWTIRVAVVFYIVATSAWLARRDALARVAWTLGCVLYIAHVTAAFQYVHDWSHAAAYRETARQTATLFGMDWGGGLYFNYAFSLLWIADAAYWWRGLDLYRSRRRAITLTVHWFMAFMFFNATVVFASGAMRWIGVAATIGLGVQTLRAARRDRPRSSPPPSPQS